MEKLFSYNEFIGESNVSDRKSMNEGSGNKIIGYTQSEKPIYSDFNHEGHEDFDSEDHHNASILNSSIAHKMLNSKSFDKSNGSEDMEKFKKLNRESKRHVNKAAKMRDAEKRQENQRSNYDYMGKHPYN